MVVRLEKVQKVFMFLQEPFLDTVASHTTLRFTKKIPSLALFPSTQNTLNLEFSLICLYFAAVFVSEQNASSK